MRSRDGAHIAQYVLHDEIAAGGMGAVHVGRMRGAAGFSRIVAIKRLHPHLAREPEFHRMFLDEARLAGRVRHPNVVPTLDVVESDGEILIVMEYVHGESLARLTALARDAERPIPLGVVSAIMSGLLYGLHAAHESTDERGTPLGLVHRDISPQNVIVGVDGLARVIDFGVAKAMGRLQSTGDGRRKGKLAYMAPEQVRAERVDRRTDVYAAGVVLWETLTGQRLFHADNDAATVSEILLGHVEPPSARVPGLPKALDHVVLRALSREPVHRFPTAREMGAALIDACSPAAPHEVGDWAEGLAHETLAARVLLLEQLEGRRGSTVREATTVVEGTTLRTAEAVPPDRSRGWGRTAFGFAGLSVAAVIVAWLGSWYLGDQRARAAVTEVAPTASVPSPPADAASQTSSSASAAVPLPASAAPAPAGRALDRTPARSQTSSAARRDHCSPPYVRDSTGLKIWKRDCLARNP